MAVCKCKMCGGDLLVTGLDRVAECEFCGTQQTVPGADSEKKLTLFNRANRLRLNGEFDRAASLYEQIAAEFPEEAEAYWGLCLCNYGIEYVDDPATGTKKPTCHRASFSRLGEDENYRLALEYAETDAQRVYREEAREIDRINEEILSISRTEKPYDVFICYKETDEAGNRTPDSVMAQDVYDALTDKGYKVFFARISLEDKLGIQYEPYIFAALNSAKIMLAVGTKYEYFHAVWVKNEWSRFLRLAAKDKSKHLIPCYKDMDPYDMPDEFRGLQAQDLNKLGAVQDLMRGIGKLLPKNEAGHEAAAGGATVSSLLRRVSIFLNSGDWNSARDYCNKVLDVSPEDPDAYEKLLLAENCCRDTNALAQLDTAYDQTPAYQNAYRFAGPDGRARLDGCVRARSERRAAFEREKKYNEAVALAKETASAEKQEKAVGLFKELGDYKDSPALLSRTNEVYCSLLYAEGMNLSGAPGRTERLKAAGCFEKIPTYRDAASRFAALIQGLYNEQNQEIIRTQAELNGAFQARDGISARLRAEEAALNAVSGSIKNTVAQRDACEASYRNLFYTGVNKVGGLLFVFVFPVFVMLIALITENGDIDVETLLQGYLGFVAINVVLLFFERIFVRIAKKRGLLAMAAANLLLWPKRVSLSSKLKKLRSATDDYDRKETALRNDREQLRQVEENIVSRQQRLNAMTAENNDLRARYLRFTGN